jgi:hypothetical protein
MSQTVADAMAVIRQAVHLPATPAPWNPEREFTTTCRFCDAPCTVEVRGEGPFQVAVSHDGATCPEGAQFLENQS